MTASGLRKSALAALRVGLACCAALACACASSGAAEPPAGIMITDLLDRPVDLRTLPAGRTMLLFVCDPALTRCREGAVYFDTQAGRIEERKIHPACVLLASLEDAREAAFRMDLHVPVFVDSARTITETLISQKVLPAMVLLDGDGNVIKITLGGGESLDGNLTAMLETRHGHHRLLLSILITLALSGIILFMVERRE
jgi:hypothetical protein